jgi:hypothetical protein
MLPLAAQRYQQCQLETPLTIQRKLTLELQ